MNRKRNAHQQEKRALKKARRAAERAESLANPSPQLRAPASAPPSYSWEIANRPGLTPRSIQLTVRQLSRISGEVSESALVVAPIRPEHYALELCCVQNVLKKVELDGGEAAYGWTLNPRVSEHGPYVFFQHHAVWKAADGTLLDITPLTRDPRHHPLRVRDGTLFLPDPTAVPTETELGPAVLPNRIHALTGSPELRQYLDGLTEAERNAPHRVGIVPA